MTAAVEPHPADVANDVIRRTVRALRSGHGADVRQIAAHLGMSRGSFYNRLNGASVFTGGDLVLLAALFAVTVQEICDGVVRIEQDAPVANMPRYWSDSGRGIVGASQVGTVIEVPAERWRPPASGE